MNRGGMILLLVGVLLWCRCTKAPVAGGGASETVATVTPYEQGLQISVTGEGVFSVQAAVYHSEYSLADSAHFSSTSTMSEASSEWRVPVLSDSVFNVFVIDTVNGTGAAFQYDNQADSTRKPQVKKLSALGGITGGVTITSLERGDTIVPVGNRVVVAGSAFSAIISDNGTYQLSGLPEAMYSLTLDMMLKTYVRNEPADTVAVSGDRISTFDLHFDN